MIAKLEWTQSNALQNKDNHRTPTNNGKYIKHVYLEYYKNDYELEFESEPWEHCNRGHIYFNSKEHGIITELLSLKVKVLLKN